jgi:hypothetical protein
MCCAVEMKAGASIFIHSAAVLMVRNEKCVPPPFSNPREALRTVSPGM